MKYSLITICIILTILPCYSQLDHTMIRTEINKMVGDAYKDKYEILKSIEANNITAVFLTPPYREFPNVIFFKTIKGTYRRIFEGLTIGIVDSTSAILDLHTLGIAVDAYIGNSPNLDFSSADMKKLIVACKNKNTPIIIYRNFMHMHPMPSIEAAYVIDKTNFLTLAIAFFNKTCRSGYWEGYSTDECMMYDLPRIFSMDFKYLNNRYIVAAHTSNNQNWDISFSDADDANCFLLNKLTIMN